MMELPYTVLLLISALIGYGFGSIPWGLLLTRFFGQGDIRNIGSGNIGATNVLRTGKKTIAFAVLILDGGKGAVAMWLVLILGLGIWWRDDPVLAAGLGAILGHNFPIWLRFKGGKGVATSLGILTMLNWPSGLLVGASWLLVAMVTRYSSLAALVSLSLSPAYIWWFTDDRPAAYFGALLAFLCFLRHRDNIRRLCRGEESKIKLKKT